MCRTVSFFINARTSEVKVWDLSSHENTAKHHGIRDADRPSESWREGHYLPDGTIECRPMATDPYKKQEYEASVCAKWPTFIQFLNWALKNCDPLQSLDLYSLQSAEGLTLPEKCGYVYASDKVREQICKKKGQSK